MSQESESPLLLYQTSDGRTHLEVRLENETVWLTQAQMAELFQRDRSVITKHIRNLFAEGELAENSVCANYAHTAADGKIYQTVCYNLDVIISVGYREPSLRAGRRIACPEGDVRSQPCSSLRCHRSLARPVHRGR